MQNAPEPERALGRMLFGGLVTVIARINERLLQSVSAYLIQNGNGQPLTQFPLHSRFDKARRRAKIDFLFRDIRTKAATDTDDFAHSQTLLDQKDRDMTEHYVKARSGARVKPLR